jgi:RNA ligase
MKYDINILNQYIDKGWVVKTNHPTLPIALFNYSRNTQYENNWDEITLSCRGLILDNEGNVVAGGMSKFFNYEEVTKEIPFKDDYVYVQEKMDGSLGILFYYNNEWHLATKGSFKSVQSVKGLEMIKLKYDLKLFHNEMTYIVEILYDENRIVVKYPEEKVVFLSVFSNGMELQWGTAKSIFHSSGIYESDVVKTEQYFSFGEDLYKSLKEKNEDNKEGFVLRFFPSNFRMKIKFEDYVRLHRILTEFSNVDIWEYLKEGKDINELLNRVPDEFDKWVKSTIRDLRYFYFQYNERAGKLFDHKMYGKYNDLEPETNKKKYAEWVMKQEEPLRPILFKMFNKKDYSKYIWKMIKPEYSKPFWKKEDYI